MTNKIFTSVPDLASLKIAIDKVGVEERVDRFQKRSIKNESKLEGLKKILNMIDLTTLEGKDTPSKVKQMCYKAMHVHDGAAIGAVIAVAVAGG